MTDKITEKILRLRNMVSENGASEQEAITAMEKADKLMAEHGISESDLRSAEASKDMREGIFKHKMKTQHPSSKFCSMTIGEFCNVIPWYSPKTSSQKGFGFHQDIDMYEFLSKMIHDTMDREWKAWLKDNPPSRVSRHTEYWSFMGGIANRVNAKLRALINERKASVTTTGTDLVEMKMDVVISGMEKLLPDIKLAKSKAKGTRMTNGAYQAGQAAGDKINLNRPLGSSSGVKALR